MIECLKASGLEIKDIKQFMDWATQGAETYEKRRELFEARREVIEAEISNLQKMLDMVKFKCWYYETAIKDGNEDGISAMLPNNLPKDIQPIYDNAHS